jgi:hypothetical protein
MFSGTRSSPSRGDGVGAGRAGDRAGGSYFIAGVPTRAGDRLPGMGKENTVSRSRTDSSPGDFGWSELDTDKCIGDRGAEWMERGDGR